MSRVDRVDVRRTVVPRGVALLVSMLSLLAFAAMARAEGQSPAPPAPVEASPAASPRWTLIEESDQGGPDAPGDKLITTQTELAALWKQLHRNIVQGAPECPKVDLAGRSVAAVYMGQKSTGGYGLKVTGVSDPDAKTGTVAVTVCESAPPADSMSIEVITSPYVLISIPAGAKGILVTRSSCE